MKKKKIPDPHKPLTSKEWKAMGKAMHGINELPEAARKAVVRSRGRPKLSSPKKHINIRVDAEIIEALQATGKGWQTRLNALLLNAVRQGLV